MEYRAPRLRWTRSGSRPAPVRVEVEGELGPICQRHHLELPFALSLLHAMLLVGLAGLAGQRNGLDRRQSLALALGLVLDIDLRQAIVGGLRQRRRVERTARIGLHVQP